MNVSILAVLLMALLASAQPTQAIEWASPTQEAAFRYGPFPQLASGGFGSGKTFAYCLKALWLSDAFPGNRGVIFRTVAKELRLTTMATFKKLCPPSAYDPLYGGSWNRMEGQTVLNNGSEVLWLGLDNPELEQIIKGLEINWFLGDQVEDASEEIFDTLLSRLGRWDMAHVPTWLIQQEEQRSGRPWPWVHPTSGKPVPPTYAMATCNPDTELHWLYRRFHPESPERHEKKITHVDALGEPTGALVSYADLGYRLFDMPSTDNRFLPAQNKAHLLSQDAAFKHRYVYGRWGLPEGAIHVIDKRSEIVLETPAQAEAFLTMLRETCTLHRFLDHGDSAPTVCAWVAVDRNGNVIVYREYYVPNQLISYHRREITQLSVDERYDFNHADPSIFNKTMQKHGGRWSVADDYEDTDTDHGFVPGDALFWQKADNNELGTRNRINEYLKIDPDRVHPFTRTKGAPRLYFVTRTDAYQNGCAHIVRETRSQRRLKIATEMGRPIFSDERDERIVDHGYDVVRYAIASRASSGRSTAKTPPANTFAGQSRLLKKYARDQRVRR